MASLGGAARWEVDDRAIGTTLTREYLPKGAQGGFLNPADGIAPVDQSSDDEAFSSARLTRFWRLGWQMTVNASKPTLLRFHTFWFPGWQARIDGLPVEVRPTGPLALLSLSVPAGEHDVQVVFADSMPRTLGWGASAATCALLLTCATLRSRSNLRSALKAVRRRERAITRDTGRLRDSTPPAAFDTVSIRRRALLVTLLLVTAAFGSGVLLFVVGTESVGREKVPNLNSVEMGKALRLLGGAASQSAPGQVRLTLFWQAKEITNEEPQIGVRLLNASGAVVAEQRGRPIWGTSTPTAWNVNEVVRDEREIRLPAGTAGGEFTIELQAGSTRAPVGRVNLSEPRSAGSGRDWPSTYGLVESGVLVAQGEMKVGAYALDGVERDGSLQIGRSIHLSLGWTALGQSDDDREVVVRLVGANDYEADSSVYNPADGFVPTTVWLAGDRATSEQRLVLREDAPAGRYWLQVGLRTFRTRPEPFALRNLGLLGPYKLAQPQNVPQPEHGLAVDFGSAVRLLGYGLEDENETLVLYWQSQQTSGRDYTKFIHLLDDSGNLVGQTDSPPLGGAYPTSLWSSGEYVTERVELPLSAKARQIRLGLYEPDSGRRLSTATGDSVVIPLAP